jgi:ADP-ribosylglycohydrolase
MHAMSASPDRIRGAWQGRISGCILGKPLEVLSFRHGRAGVEAYLRDAQALPLRDYVPLLEGRVENPGRGCCRGRIIRSEPDDDINYTVLALLLLEEKGTGFVLADVARQWLRLLPAGSTWTAERAAYRTLLCDASDEFVNGEEPGFDLSDCSDNEYSDWIGAQIRADLYGWVCPGQPSLAAELAGRDASLSHRGDGVNAAAFVAALAAALPATDDLDIAIDAALDQIPPRSGAAEAVRLGSDLRNCPEAVQRLHDHYQGLPPVHALNNLAVVAWSLSPSGGAFSAGIGNAVSAGWDTDCNGATVGGLLGISGASIPDHWTRPWNGRIGLSVAGHDELALDDVVSRTLAVAKTIEHERNQPSEALFA